MTMPMPGENPDFGEMMAQMASQITGMIKPLLREHLISIQENPETRFAIVVGEEVMVDFDKLIEAIMTVPPPPM